MEILTVIIKICIALLFIFVILLAGFALMIFASRDESWARTKKGGADGATS